MKSQLTSFLTTSLLALALLPTACGGDASEGSSGDRDKGGDGDTKGDGDLGGDADGDSGSGGSSGDGDGDRSSGGDAGDGDGESGGSSGDGDGGTGGSSGDGGSGAATGGSSSGGAAATGPCWDESCGGDCAPPEDGAPHCAEEWICLNVFTCSRDLASYCGCDGKTFQGSSNCAPYAYAHRGACEDGYLGGLNCDASQVVTDDLPPNCEYGTLAAVSGGTWTGACVKVEECGCAPGSSQDDCGPEYVCYNSGRCGHLLR